MNILQALFGGEFYLLKLVFWCAISIFITIKILAYNFSLTKSMNKIDAMSGEDFELYVARVLQKYGFRDVCLTGGSGDFGVDILASFKKIRYAIQVKRYNSLVGIAAVQEAYSGAKYYEVDAAIVITNSHFTDAAKSLADSCDVILINRKAFIDKSFTQYLT